MLISFIDGFLNSLKSKRMITLIYLSTLILGLLAAIPFFGTAKSNFTNTLLLKDLLYDFDYTAYSDIMHNLGDVITPFFSILKWFGIGYFFFSIFLAGGILETMINSKNRFYLKTFLYSSAQYLGRFFRTALYTLILQAVSLLFISIPFILFFEFYMDSAKNETEIFYIFSLYMTLSLVVFYFWVIISDYTRIRIVTEQTDKVLVSMWKSIKFVFKNLKSILLYIMTFGFPVLITLLYLLLEDKIGMTSKLNILIMIIIQQVFIWFKAFSKIWVFSSQVCFYERKSITLKMKKDTEEDIDFHEEEYETA